MTDEQFSKLFQLGDFAWLVGCDIATDLFSIVKVEIVSFHSSLLREHYHGKWYQCFRHSAGNYIHKWHVEPGNADSDVLLRAFTNYDDAWRNFMTRTNVLITQSEAELTRHLEIFAARKAALNKSIELAVGPLTSSSNVL